MTAEQAASILLAHYNAEVQARHRKFVQDQPTLDMIRQFATALTSDDSKFGVMFCGGVGNGKTTMLYALRGAISWLKDGGYLGRDIATPRIITAKEICTLAKSKEDDYLQLRAFKMLAIDEIGGEPAEVVNYGNVISPVMDLLEYRYVEQLPTFLTTNLDASEIRGKYGDRIADRFNEMLSVIIFRRNSYRST
jgi:DNA replication protein DnaC